MKRKNKRMGCIAIGLGATVIFAMVLPSGFWFFVVGIALICCGIAILRK